MFWESVHILLILRSILNKNLANIIINCSKDAEESVADHYFFTLFEYAFIAVRTLSPRGRPRPQTEGRLQRDMGGESEASAVVSV